MDYFRFRNDVFFVRGNVASAIYDINNKKIYICNERETKILHDIMERGLNDEHATDKHFSLFLKRIHHLNLGELYKSKIYVEKVKLNSPLAYEIRGFRSVYYHIFYINITNKCDWECSFCPIDDATITFKECQTCLIRSQSNQRKLDVNKLLNQLIQLGPSTVCIRGGNPLLEWELLRYILSIIKRNPKISVILTTPGTGIAINEITRLFQVHDNLMLNIVVNCEDSDRKKSGNRRRGENQISLIILLRRLKVSFFLTLMSSGGNYGRLIDVCGSQWKINPGISFVHKGADDNQMIQCHRIDWRCLPLKNWNSKEEFFIRYNFYPCLLGTLDIDLSGSIKPCPGFSNLVHSAYRIASNGLIFTLKDYELYEAAQRNDNNDLSCSECPIRFICLNCPSFNQQLRLYDKIKIFCPYYNPIIGLNYGLLKRKYDFISRL